MRLPILQAIYQKEMLDIFRDRRTMISMVVVPLLVFPLLISISMRLTARVQQNAETEARSMGLAVHGVTPAVRDALEKTGIPVTERDNLADAVQNKRVAAAAEETPGAPDEIRIYVDRSNPTSVSAGDKILFALDDLKDRTIREHLRNSGVPESVLVPFTIQRTNVAGERKMAGAIWGTMLPYLLLLLMFTGGMYPVIDMTAGEKERKTLEAFLASPATRREIVMGKTLAAMTAIFLTAALTLGSMVYSIRSNRISAKSEELKQMMGSIPLDPHTIAMIGATLIPMSIFAASIMFAIALFARSFKEGQSYLTPLALVVIFPALLGGLPGLQFTPTLCLIPIFNASMVLRGIMLGEITSTNFAVTTAANLIYAAIAFLIAKRTFERESVLFRS